MAAREPEGSHRLGSAAQPAQARAGPPSRGSPPAQPTAGSATRDAALAAGGDGGVSAGAAGHAAAGAGVRLRIRGECRLGETLIAELLPPAQPSNDAMGEGGGGVGGGARSLQWFSAAEGAGRRGRPIDGATAPTLLLTAEEVGLVVSVALLAPPPSRADGGGRAGGASSAAAAASGVGGAVMAEASASTAVALSAEVRGIAAVRAGRAQRRRPLSCCALTATRTLPRHAALRCSRLRSPRSWPPR